MKKEYYNPNVMYKFGQTSNVDAAERLSVEYSDKHKFRAVPLGRDYIVTVMWSAWVDKKEAYQLENAFKANIPKLLQTDVTYNGITECRVLSQEEVDIICDNLRQRYPKPAYNYRPGKQKVYFLKLTKKSRLK